MILMLEGLEHLVRIRSSWCHCLDLGCLQETVLGLGIKERVTDTGCDDSIAPVSVDRFRSSSLCRTDPS